MLPVHAGTQQPVVEARPAIRDRVLLVLAGACADVRGARCIGVDLAD